MSIETKKNDDIIATIQSSHNQEKYQFQQKIMTLEEELNKRDDELNELKLAYKEKMRKCVAWEKVHILK
jgi:cell division protein FtsL